MPSYTFEIATEQGQERHAFTLDDDRPLRQQVTQILEELRQRGVLLRGGPTDVLGIYQGGRELDAASPPATLGLLPGLPIELRMRERERAPSVRARLPRGVLGSALFGYAGAFVAWLITARVHDLGGAISSYTRLDQTAVALLGALTGAAILAGGALRQQKSVALAAGSGLLLGAAGALIGASLVLLTTHPITATGFVLTRLGGWALTGFFAAALLALHALPVSWSRVAESAALGAVTGALSGALLGLPGPASLWQAAGWLLFGAALGVAVMGPLLWHAPGLVEQHHARGMPGMLTLREWPVLDGTSVALGAAQVAAQDGRVAFYPPSGGASVNERGVTEPVYLDGASLVATGGSRYEVHVRTVAG
jgi:hypothetical protein